MSEKCLQYHQTREHGNRMLKIAQDSSENLESTADIKMNKRVEGKFVIIKQ